MADVPKTEIECRLLGDSSLLEDEDDIAGEDHPTHLLQEPGHYSNFSSTQISAFENVKPSGVP